MAVKISKMPPSVVMTGEEYLPVVSNGVNYKVKTKELFSLNPSLVKTAIQLNNVTNTSDANKPITTAFQAALDLKAPLGSVPEASIMPEPGVITLSNPTNSTIDFAFNIVSCNGYDMQSVVMTVQYMNPATDTVWTDGTVVAFVDGQLSYSGVLTGLAVGTNYAVRVHFTDINSGGLDLTTTSGQLATLAQVVDADSSFDIVGTSFGCQSVLAKDVDVVGIAPTFAASSDTAFVESVEVAQQTGQNDFAAIQSVISFRPNKYTVNIASTAASLVLDIANGSDTIQPGDVLFTVEGGTLTERSVNTATVDATNGIVTITYVTAPTVVPSAVYQAGQTLKAYMAAATKYTNNPNPLETDPAADIGNMKMATAVTDIATWTQEPLSLPTGMVITGHAIIGNSLYLFAYQYADPSSNNGPYSGSTVYKADLTSCGLSAFTVHSTLADQAGLGKVVVTSSRVYVLTGLNATDRSLSAQWVPINPDGTIGTTWTLDSTNPLPTAAFGYSIAVTPSRVYVIGGSDNGANNGLSAIQYAPINPDGSLGAWVLDTNTLAAPLVGGTSYGGITQAACVQTDKFIYLLGGVDNYGNYLNSIMAAPVNTDGTIGVFTQVGTLPKESYYPACFYFNNRIFVSNGGNNTALHSTDLYSAPINVDGTIGAWVTVSPLPQATEATAFVIIGTKVYMLGGYYHDPSSPVSTGFMAARIYSGPIDGWLVGRGSYFLDTSNYINLTALSKTLVNDTVTATSTKYVAGGRFASVGIGLRTGDVITEIVGNVWSS